MDSFTVDVDFVVDRDFTRPFTSRVRVTDVAFDFEAMLVAEQMVASRADTMPTGSRLVL